MSGYSHSADSVMYVTALSIHIVTAGYCRAIHVTCTSLKLVAASAAEGVVQANVGQKLLTRNIVSVFTMSVGGPAKNFFFCPKHHF
jgi:hypothetical protein